VPMHVMQSSAGSFGPDGEGTANSDDAVGAGGGAMGGAAVADILGRPNLL